LLIIIIHNSQKTLLLLNERYKKKDYKHFLGVQQQW